VRSALADVISSSRPKSHSVHTTGPVFRPRDRWRDPWLQNPFLMHGVQSSVSQNARQTLPLAFFKLKLLQLEKTSLCSARRSPPSRILKVEMHTKPRLDSTAYPDPAPPLPSHHSVLLAHGRLCRPAGPRLIAPLMIPLPVLYCSRHWHWPTSRRCALRSGLAWLGGAAIPELRIIIPSMGRGGRRLLRRAGVP